MHIFKPLMRAQMTIWHFGFDRNALRAFSGEEKLNSLEHSQVSITQSLPPCNSARRPEQKTNKKDDADISIANGKFFIPTSKFAKCPALHLNPLHKCSSFRHIRTIRMIQLLNLECTVTAVSSCSWNSSMTMSEIRQRETRCHIEMVPCLYAPHDHLWDLSCRSIFRVTLNEVAEIISKWQPCYCFR